MLSVLVASAVIIVAILPLGNTDWADSFRGAPSVEAENAPVVGEGEETPLIGIVRAVDAFLKVVLFMGIPALITLGVLRRVSRKPNQNKEEKKQLC
jgi:hypothetical protein